jgi:hypothetical protein
VHRPCMRIPSPSSFCPPTTPRAVAREAWGERCVVCGWCAARGWCVIRWSVVHHRHFHTPSTPRAGAREAGGAWVVGAMVLRARGGYGDVSNVARVMGLGGTYRAGIPLHGSPGVPLTLLIPVHGLTSCFDGEEGVSAAILRWG